MAGLEVVVRPFIFPDIRPRARQSLPPQDDPEKGFARIDGQPAKAVTMTYSQSISSSHSRPKEVERRVDETRVYQMDDDGTVNRDNFVDLQVATKIKMAEPFGYSSPPGFVGFTGDDVVPTYPGRGYTGDDIKEHFYAPAKEKDNVEIKRKNVKLKDGEEVQ